MRVILMLSQRRFGHSVWTEHQRQHEVAQVSITLDRYSHMTPQADEQRRRSHGPVVG
jgi:hypothetical protein